jgi:hypothetical protein
MGQRWRLNGLAVPCAKGKLLDIEQLKNQCKVTVNNHWKELEAVSMEFGVHRQTEGR